MKQHNSAPGIRSAAFQSPVQKVSHWFGAAFILQQVASSQAASFRGALFCCSPVLTSDHLSGGWNDKEETTGVRLRQRFPPPPAPRHLLGCLGVLAPVALEGHFVGLFVCGAVGPCFPTSGTGAIRRLPSSAWLGAATAAPHTTAVLLGNRNAVPRSTRAQKGTHARTQVHTQRHGKAA